MSGQSDSTADLRCQVAKLSAERLSLLKVKGFPEDYLQPRYFCPHCQDTGYADGKKCSCFKKAEIELLYTQSNLADILQKENFEHFSFDWYSDTIKNEATGLTAKETARKAYDAAWNFVQDFDSCWQNLFCTAAPEQARPFFPTVLLTSLSKALTAYFIFQPLTFLTGWRRTPSDTKPRRIRERNLFTTVIF